MNRSLVTRPDPPKAPEPKPVQPPIAATAPVPLLSEEPHLFQWLLGTNPVVRVGIVVLLCGVAFFLNYVIERGWLPVEVRLTMAAIGGLALTAIGWRLRESQRDYGLVLQGGGIGIVYMTVFAAVNLYAVLGAGSGLALMVALVVLTSAFAVLQNSQSMAVFASLAGFAAPVLVSHGDNHVALFSYYAVLDASILAIAWFRRWQLLNRLGFVCTFLLSAAWGTRYTPQDISPAPSPSLSCFSCSTSSCPCCLRAGSQMIGRRLSTGRSSSVCRLSRSACKRN